MTYDARYHDESVSNVNGAAISSMSMKAAREIVILATLSMEPAISSPEAWLMVVLS